MTSVAAKICRSPTLYFTYQESTRLAIPRKLGIAYFEAWAIMSQSGGQSRLKGVLAVLQLGVDSNFHHDSLGRMVRAAGLGYTGTHEAPESALGQKSRQAQENSKPFS